MRTKIIKKHLIKSKPLKLICIDSMEQHEGQISFPRIKLLSSSETKVEK